MKRILLGAAMAALAMAASAQTNTTSPGQSTGEGNLSATTTPPATTELTSEAKQRSAIAAAKQLVKANKAADAETALTTANRSNPNTADFHFETAQRLIEVAEQLAREGEPQYVAALMSRALQQLQQAEARGKNAEEKAAAKTLAGFIHERYLADPAAARTAYEAAASLAPGKALQAAESAARLKRADDILKERAARGGK